MAVDYDLVQLLLGPGSGSSLPLGRRGPGRAPSSPARTSRRSLSCCLGERWLVDSPARPERRRRRTASPRLSLSLMIPTVRWVLPHPGWPVRSSHPLGGPLHRPAPFRRRTSASPSPGTCRARSTSQPEGVQGHLLQHRALQSPHFTQKQRVVQANGHYVR